MKARKKNSPLFVGVAAVSLLIIFGGGYLVGFKDRTRSERLPSSVGMSPGTFGQPAPPILDSKAMEIVQELNCICGCKMELATCTCEDAKGSKEIKLFVQDLVNQEFPRTETLKRLEEKYGKSVMIKQKS